MRRSHYSTQQLGENRGIKWLGNGSMNLTPQTTTYAQGKCWMLIPTTLSGLLTGVLRGDHAIFGIVH
jgi:hypothetical protein